MNRMRKTWQTGTMARARAVRILRRDLSRPKRRRTRRARMIRAMPVGSLVRTRETRDMPTTNMSSQHHISWKKGRNQDAKATAASSTVKMRVKKRFARSRAAPKLETEPSALESSLTYCDSRIVQTKLCESRTRSDHDISTTNLERTGLTPTMIRATRVWQIMCPYISFTLI